VLIEFARQLPRRAAPGLGLAMARSSRLERRLVALRGLIVLAPLSRTGVRIASLVAVGALGSLTGLTLLKAETAAPSSDAAAQTNEDQAEGAAPRPAEEAPVEAPTVKSDSAESLELANRLVAAQKQVAELKREDFIAVGMAEVTRPKFAAALRNYEGLRTQVMNQRPPRQPAAEGDNYELYFDGVTSFVELPTLKYIGEVPYTIEAVISPEPIPGYKVNPETHSYAHYMAVIADTEFGGMELSLHPNKLTFEVNSRSSGWYMTAEKPCLPFLEPRMHVAAVVEQNELRLYKNGVLVGSGPFDGTVGLSPLTMRIGCSPHPVTECHEMFRGYIDEVRFTADALYSDDFAAPKRLEATEATIALYHFDEGQGDRVKDASANGHDGVIHDARWVRAAE
jgi:hypothetical protein